MRYTVVEASGEVEIFDSLLSLFGYVEYLYFDREQQVTRSSLKKKIKEAAEKNGSVEMFDFSEVYSTHNSRNNSDWYVKVKLHKPQSK
ncbi:hypothetical protein [Vibrio sp. D431a]|uniref:hypothetical protein n=1 Tax=Vibrio sp. D431a TaxID=2837388 RepID=UPI0025554B28|nr:hypothetical protein [Vibrio sp. D431a]MDK9789825.1 hypothetical protein [Vibrio sp. D431a]